jgi:hypothetical protein
MRAHVRGGVALLLAALLGCSSRAGKPVAVAGYGGVDQGVVFAWAWGGAPGFEDDDPSPVSVLVATEPGDSSHRLLRCDPAESPCKSLDDFTDTGESAEEREDSAFLVFDTGMRQQDLLFLVVADRGARLVTSDVITAAARSRPTAYSSNELRFDPRTQQLAWPRVPDSDLFVLALVDETGEEPLTAITTRRKSWSYPELQGIVQHWHDPSQVPELRRGRRYVATLYSVNRQRWATYVTSAVVKP